MIQEDNLLPIGKILKPHGVAGEVTVLFNEPAFADLETDFYFLFIDGMYIPFFVEDFIFNSDTTARIKFEGIDTIEKASDYSNISIYFHQNELEDIEAEDTINSDWEYFIGFSVIDQNASFIGIIRQVDSSTINQLFIVEKDQQEILIPATADFILDVDNESKKVFMELPEGLLHNALEI